MERSLPNILITGTPGTGKTTTAEMVAIATNLQHIEVGKIVKEKGLHEGVDEKFDSLILDEDRVVDELEPIIQEGGKVVDYHGCDFFPERWFDLVVVLRTDNGVLYERLEKRNYSQLKITENIQCEIMQVILEEARESYAEEVVVELKSNTVDEMEENVERIQQWAESWVRNRAN